MADALRASGRDILFSISNNSSGNILGEVVNLSKIANSWRRWKTVHGRSVFFNHSPGPASATLPFSLLGLTGKQAPRDLWRQKDLGTFDTHFTAETQSHGVVLIRLIPITATN